MRTIIAGTASIPQDLRATTDLLRLPALDRWRTLLLPALFPYIVTGAWNASIVAEHVQFGGRVYETSGVGAAIARATASGDYVLLLAGTLALVDQVYAAVAGRRRLSRLPAARLNALAGLPEKLAAEGGQADLGADLQLELDDLLPIVEAGELLDFNWIYETLQADDNQRIACDYFLESLQREMGDAAARQLDIAVNWGRFAELFAYDDDSGELYLES